MIPPDANLLRLYVDAGDRAHGRPAHEALVVKARELGLAGASVFPGAIGYGRHRVLHDIQSEYAFTDAPLVVEAIDAPARIEAALAELRPLAGDGLATLQPVRVVHGTTEAAAPGAPTMQTEGAATRLTIYVGSSDTWHGANLAVAIVDRCRRLGLAGATATRGVMGFGRNSRIHRAHLLGLSEDLPEKIEVIDAPARIEAALPELAAMVGSGLILVEEVRIVEHAAGA